MLVLFWFALHTHTANSHPVLLPKWLKWSGLVKAEAKNQKQSRSPEDGTHVLPACVHINRQLE